MRFKHLTFGDKFKFITYCINITSLVILAITTIGLTLINYFCNMNMSYLLYIPPGFYVFYFFYKVNVTLTHLSYFNFGRLMDEDIQSMDDYNDRFGNYTRFKSRSYDIELPIRINWGKYDLAYKRENILNELIEEN